MTTIWTSSNLDVLFTGFSLCRNGAITLVQTGKTDELIDKIYGEYIPIDPDCLTSTGKYFDEGGDKLDGNNSSTINVNRNVSFEDMLINETTRRLFCCKGCSALESMTDLSPKISRGDSFKLQSGHKAGHTMCLKIGPTSSPYGVVTNKPRIYLEQLLPLTDVDLVTSRMRNTTFLSLDAFTNSVIVNWIVDRMLTDKSLPFSTDLIYTAFVCGRQGYTLHDCPQPIEITSIKPTNLSKIIKRMASCLSVLQHHNYSHGVIDSSSIRFTFSYSKFRGSRDKGEPHIQFANFEYASITIDGRQGPLRLFQRSDIADIEMEGTLLRFPFTVEEIESDTPVRVFKLSRLSHSQQIFIKNLGLPFYSTSYDTYRFVLVLLTHPSVYPIAIEDQFTKSMLTSLFPELTQSEVLGELKSLSLTNRTNHDVLKVLENKYLTTDPLSIILTKK